MSAKQAMMDRFECEDCGELKEYVGCKIDRDGRELKFTQPVLLQSYSDEFELPERKMTTPATPGSVLQKVEKGQGVVEGEADEVSLGCWKVDAYDALLPSRDLQFCSRLGQAHDNGRRGAFCGDGTSDEVLRRHRGSWSGLEARRRVGWQAG